MFYFGLPVICLRRRADEVSTKGFFFIIIKPFFVVLYCFPSLFNLDALFLSSHVHSFLKCRPKGDCLSFPPCVQYPLYVH